MRLRKSSKPKFKFGRESAIEGASADANGGRMALVDNEGSKDDMIKRYKALPINQSEIYEAIFTGLIAILFFVVKILSQLRVEIGQVRVEAVARQLERARPYTVITI